MNETALCRTRHSAVSFTGGFRTPAQRPWRVWQAQRAGRHPKPVTFSDSVDKPRFWAIGLSQCWRPTSRVARGGAGDPLVGGGNDQSRDPILAPDACYGDAAER